MKSMTEEKGQSWRSVVWDVVSLPGVGRYDTHVAVDGRSNAAVRVRRLLLVYLGQPFHHGFDLVLGHLGVVAGVRLRPLGRLLVQPLHGLLDLILGHLLVAHAELRLEDGAPGQLGLVRPHAGPQ